jgi:hypothetical protein
VLRRIFRPEKGVCIRAWRKLHNGELYNLYCLPIIITLIKSWRMRWDDLIARYVKEDKSIQKFGRMPAGDRPLGRPRCR